MRQSLSSKVSRFSAAFKKSTSVKEHMSAHSDQTKNTNKKRHLRDLVIHTRCLNVSGKCIGFGFKIQTKYSRYGLFTYKPGSFWEPKK